MTKTYRQLVLGILSATETALLEIVSRAAESGDYSGIDLARSTAEEIKGIRSRFMGDGDGKELVFGASGRGLPRRRKRNEAVAAANRDKSSYPRFKITASTLTKIGWSKKRNREYEHKISRETFEAVVAALLASRKRTHGPISTELVHECLASDGRVRPTYQTYLVLAFLRSKNVIQLIARGDYAVPNDVDQKANSEWLSAERGSE